MKCFECNNIAEHQHHIVAKSKGGFNTIPLCNVCHGKVHGISMQTSYLVKLALMKKELELHCRIFWLYVVENCTISEIRQTLVSENYPITNARIKKRLQVMQIISDEDLIDTFNPILRFKTNAYYTISYIKMLIRSTLKNENYSGLTK